jgi:uncharacterized membrane protein YhaH (DUF805 family)
MSFSEAIKDGFDHYTNFQGRASRAAFWYWVLFGLLVGIAANILDSAIFDGPLLSYLVSLALFLPGLSVAIRRLHDTGRSGWWYLIILVPLIGIIVLIVFWVEQGHSGPNEYGPEPADRVGGAAGSPPPAAPPPAA